MSYEKMSEPSPANCQAEEQNDQSTFTYGNQYNQNPIGNQYPSPGCAQNPGYQYTNQSQYNVPGQIIQPGAIVYNRAPVTQDWMIPAVLSCLLCCWPLGLMAILAASKANNAAAIGDVMEAERQSSNARTYVIASVISGVILITLYVVFRLQ
ncbi:proline rich transmembrane protein 1B isoform X1 [Magallana gigas]|uniref:proline rich transmembrane protein 1B isoform X1 n=1 Tax=Magallana gigas TaxID=29159 RepID=UPI00333F3FA2